jgi:hypothetical protein
MSYPIYTVFVLAFIKRYYWFRLEGHLIIMKEKPIISLNSRSFHWAELPTISVYNPQLQYITNITLYEIAVKPDEMFIMI